jgi:predicted ATP-grasp superfamily ATP-dependent carboligase
VKVFVDSATRNSSLAIIRSLGEEGYSVSGADERRLPFNAHSCYSSPYYDLPNDNSDSYIDALLTILDKEKPDVFFPGKNIRTCTQYQKEIEEYTHVLMPHPDAFETAFNKQKTVLLCQSLNIDCPVLLSEQEARIHISTNHSAKVVVKPDLDIGGARGLSIIDNEEELHDALEAASRLAAPMIQEYIPGPSSNMRTVNLLFDKTGKLAAYFTTQKYREWPITGGSSVLSISTDDRHLVDWVLPFFEKLNWQGAAEVEIKIDERNGKPQLIEINPRFSGYIGFAIECGVNFPKIVCEISMDEKHAGTRELPDYTTGLKYIHTSSFVRMAVQTVLSSSNKIQTLKLLHKEWRGEKVGNNIRWRDWRVILIKALFEIVNKGDLLHVRN